VGVLAANDERAHNVLEACRMTGLRVPHDVAVICVNNDALLCGLTSSTLSSIEQAATRMGYEAAAYLEQLMCGKKSRNQRFIFDPTGIITRQSTDFLAIDDPIVGRAMDFIKEHAVEAIKVPNVVAEVAVSRSGLDAHFMKATGCTIHDAIRRVQLNKARRLISDTDLPVKQIATSVGF
jgi:LacI family transcriptional regulator